MTETNEKGIVAITGAAGAIAGTVAEHFAAAGWRLALLDRPGHPDRLAERFPEALRLQADLGDPDAVAAAIERIERELGSLDALLNIAGGFSSQSAVDLTPAALTAQLDLNLRTLVHTTSAALPGMLARGRGFVLGVGSAAAVRAAARQPAYAAAKSALVGYLRSLGAEVETRGVGVAILYPMGTVDTPANRRAMPDADPGRWIRREALAEAALFLADRPAGGRVRELQVVP